MQLLFACESIRWNGN